MSTKEKDIFQLKDLNRLRTAPILNARQKHLLLKEVRPLINYADWLTIGIMAPSIKEGINATREVEQNFNLNKMKIITIPKAEGPIYLKANQNTGEIHARIEFGLGEGILIGTHFNELSLDTKIFGPFPLDFFR